MTGCQDRPRRFLAIAEVDGFAALRATLGQTFADGVCACVGERLRTAAATFTMRSSDRAAFLLEIDVPRGGNSQETLATLAHGAVRHLIVEGSRLDLPIRMGAIEIKVGTMSDAVIQQAEFALESARRTGSTALIVGSADVDANDEPLALFTRLQDAIRDNALTLHYQPKYSAREGKIVAVEALLRWFPPNRDPVPADVIVDLAERTGMIRLLTEWVIDRVLRDQSWMAACGHNVMIDLNISGLLLPDAAFAIWSLDRLKGHEGRIGFEITETAMIGNPDEALSNLKLFDAAGVRLAIDDFGAAYSSLAYLQRLPVHELKIDRCFVSRIASDNRDPLLVRSTIDLAHALGMVVTAEGVDSPEALTLLRVMGCDMLQGFLMSGAIDREALVHLMAKSANRDALYEHTKIRRRLRVERAA